MIMRTLRDEKLRNSERLHAQNTAPARAKRAARHCPNYNAAYRSFGNKKVVLSTLSREQSPCM
jgi:hypothetical protein